MTTFIKTPDPFAWYLVSHPLDIYVLTCFAPLGFNLCEIHCQKDEKYWILMVRQPLVEYAIRAGKIQISAFCNS